jgi:hypothetical protein
LCCLSVTIPERSPCHDADEQDAEKAAAKDAAIVR